MARSRSDVRRWHGATGGEGCGEEAGAMQCGYCGAALATGARFCQACGRLLPPTPPPSPPPATRPIYPPTQPGYPPGQPGVWPSQPGYQPYGQPPPMAWDPYGPFVDPRTLPPETIAAYRQHRYQATFSVLLIILVHLLTLGLASPYLLARKYAFLPVIRADDFSTGKAAGFLFIPFFNLYWVFVVCRRLADRLTLQA